MLIVKLNEIYYNIHVNASWESEDIMSFNGKHLSLEDRKIIEENICKGLRKFETAKELNKSQSTIGKEIKNNRKRRYSIKEDAPWMCKHFNECKICISKCSDFEETTPESRASGSARLVPSWN